MPKRMSREGLLERVEAMADPEVRARNIAKLKATARAWSSISPEMAKGLAEVAATKRSKYGNKVTDTPYGKFHSKGEYERYLVLLDMENSKNIFDLARQITFPLVEASETERPVKYVADFIYTRNGRLVVEEFKGFETESWKIKRKIFREKYPYIELLVTKRKKT